LLPSGTWTKRQNQFRRRGGSFLQIDVEQLQGSVPRQVFKFAGHCQRVLAILPRFLRVESPRFLFLPNVNSSCEGLAMQVLDREEASQQFSIERFVKLEDERLGRPLRR